MKSPHKFIYMGFSVQQEFWTNTTKNDASERERERDMTIPLMTDSPLHELS